MGMATVQQLVKEEKKINTPSAVSVLPSLSPPPLFSLMARFPKIGKNRSTWGEIRSSNRQMRVFFRRKTTVVGRTIQSLLLVVCPVSKSVNFSPFFFKKTNFYVNVDVPLGALKNRKFMISISGSWAVLEASRGAVRRSKKKRQSDKNQRKKSPLHPGGETSTFSC